MHLLALVLTCCFEEVEMSIRRLVVTAAAMAGIAGVLAALTPALPVMTGAVSAAQQTVDTQGVDALITSAAGLVAWSAWAWGALGLALTVAAALPGVVGGAARLALHVALPAGARRSAALLLGIGLGITTPLAAAALPALAPTASAAALWLQDVPDWPAPAPVAAALPDWPGGAVAATETRVAGQRVVVSGDCLWHIAADSLLGQLGRLPTDGEVATAVDAWWHANADVIGPDRDRLLPGQVLRAPGPP
jgi:nucleoid-associated protein YgaU